MKDPSAQYVGWAGRGNLGDDAMLLTWELALPDVRFVEAPLYREDLGRFLLQRTRTRSLTMPTVLGGGTVLGLASWLKHVRLARRLGLSRRVLALGCGGIDLADPEGSGRQVTDIRGWRDLPGFTLLGVRGPRSAELAQSLGFPAAVVGDPALLLPSLTGVNLTKPDESESVGFSFGSHAGTRYSMDEMISTIAVGQQYFGADRRVKLLAAATEDIQLAYDLRDALGLPSVEVVDARNPRVALSQLSNCAGVIAQRLHIGVLAVALGIPTVGLAYQTKIVDFYDSVEAGHSVCRGPLDRVAVSSALDAATDLRESAITIETVAALASALREGFSAVKRLLTVHGEHTG